MQHKGPIEVVIFSPDGKRLLTASADGTAQLWEVPTGLNPTTVRHMKAILAAAFSPERMDANQVLSQLSYRPK